MGSFLKAIRYVDQANIFALSGNRIKRDFGMLGQGYRTLRAPACFNCDHTISPSGGAADSGIIATENEFKELIRRNTTLHAQLSPFLEFNHHINLSLFKLAVKLDKRLIPGQFTKNHMIRKVIQELRDLIKDWDIFSKKEGERAFSLLMEHGDIYNDPSLHYSILSRIIMKEENKFLNKKANITALELLLRIGLKTKKIGKKLKESGKLFDDTFDILHLYKNNLDRLLRVHRNKFTNYIDSLEQLLEWGIEYTGQGLDPNLYFGSIIMPVLDNNESLLNPSNLPSLWKLGDIYVSLGNGLAQLDINPTDLFSTGIVTLLKNNSLLADPKNMEVSKRIASRCIEAAQDGLNPSAFVNGTETSDSGLVNAFAQNPELAQTKNIFQLNIVLQTLIGPPGE
jgi:hypothetical protein